MHLRRMDALAPALRAEANLTAMADEVVKSSAIEGEYLDSRQVRASISRRLGLEITGLPHPSRAVEAIVEILLDATLQFDHPLTADRLYAWHTALFPASRSGMPPPTTVGAWREASCDQMQVVSGPPNRERIHFEAPEAARLHGEMTRFLQWFNRPLDLDPVLKAAVAHFWFVTIHPFSDGNGRIARAIADMALARADGTQDRFYSMSAAIEADRTAYYTQLESAQRGVLDITAWLVWFLDCLDRAVESVDTILGAVLRKARLWQWIHPQPVNERQRTVINRLLDNWQGHLNTLRYTQLAKCSTDTALRDIQDLLARDILLQNTPISRSPTYRLIDPASPH